MYSLLYNEQKSKIQNLAENELDSVDSFFPERCHNSDSDLSQEISSISVTNSGSANYIENRSIYKQDVRESWYQTYSVPDGFVKDTGSAQSKHDPPEELPAFQALCWSMNTQGVDMRPHIYDKALDQYLLLDSGAQISACPPDPGDKVDPAMTLKAANGSVMHCYGTKKLTVRINRKEYSIQAIKTDVKSPILGWNFVKKHRLNFEWNDWGDICITDRKAKISSILKYKALPHGQSGLSSINIKGFKSNIPASELQFELACMESLTPETKTTSANVENDISKMPDSQYKALLTRFPDLLQLHFEEEFTKNGVQHRILTGDAKPTKAPKRHMLPGSPREIAAKEAFKKFYRVDFTPWITCHCLLGG